MTKLQPVSSPFSPDDVITNGRETYIVAAQSFDGCWVRRRGESKLIHLCYDKARKFTVRGETCK